MLLTENINTFSITTVLISEGKFKFINSLDVIKKLHHYEKINLSPYIIRK